MKRAQPRQIDFQRNPWDKVIKEAQKQKIVPTNEVLCRITGLTPAQVALRSRRVRGVSRRDRQGKTDAGQSAVDRLCNLFDALIRDVRQNRMEIERNSVIGKKRNHIYN